MHPTSIKLRTKSRLLEVAFDDGAKFELPFEYLRVYSPSAEVRGHGPGQETLQLSKHEVSINKVEPVGNYAVRLMFDDGHDTGLYTWAYLHELGREHATKWSSYLARLQELGIAYPRLGLNATPFRCVNNGIQLIVLASGDNRSSARRPALQSAPLNSTRSVQCD